MFLTLTARPAAADLELFTLLRFCRQPASYPSHGKAGRSAADEFVVVPSWLSAAYPALFSHSRLSSRLAVYDTLW